MLKHEIYHIAQTEMPESLKAFLLECFTEDEVEAFERQGGRIQINVTMLKSKNSQMVTPKAKSIVLSNDDIRNRIEELRGSSEKLQVFLDDLPVEKLKAIAKSLRIPLRSSASANEIRANLMNSLQYKENWQNISGSRERNNA